MSIPRRLTSYLGTLAVLAPLGGLVPHLPIRPARQAGPKKLALVIAIGAYDKLKTGYDSIGSLRDVPLIRGGLLAQGFDSTNIRLLLDQEATRDGIIAGLTRLADRAGPGDVLVVHYSGHGQQITDLSGDEPDGLDEMLVPYGAPNFSHAPPDYRGERHLIDDELVPLLETLRRRAGPRGNVAFFLDACFSGSATRGGGELSIRGIATPIRIRSVPTHPLVSGTDQASGVEVGGSGTRTRGGGGDDPALAPFVVISATRFDQFDHETYDEAKQQSVGPLSLALSRALPRIDSLTSYRDLFERITVQMSAMRLGNQDPQLEGNADIKVFNGQAVSPASYFQPAEILEDTLVLLNAGMFQGLFPGTAVEFRVAGSGGRGAAVLDSGMVRNALEFRATVRVSGRASRERLRDSRVFVTRYSYGDQRIRVALDRSLPPDLRTVLESQLRALPIVELNQSAAELKLAGFSPPIRGGGAARPGVVSIAVASNDTVGKLSGPADSLAGAVVGQVHAVARSSYFRRLDMKDPERNLALTLELMPAAGRVRRLGSNTVCPPLTDTVPVGAKRGPDGGTQLSPDDAFWIRVRNEGKAPAYFSILDLQADYSIGLLYPPADNSLSDVVIRPGDSFRIPDCYYATPPYGLEILKLIATTERVDFAPMVTPGLRLGGARGGSRTSPLEQLFADAFRGTRAGSGAPAGQAVTAEIALRIVPRAGPQ